MKKEQETPLAVANFRRYGTALSGEKFDETVHCELHKSGAFDYGNGTCMIFEYSTPGIPASYFDTRYEKVSPKNFTEFAKQVLTDCTIKGATIEVI